DAAQCIRYGRLQSSPNSSGGGIVRHYFFRLGQHVYKDWNCRVSLISKFAESLHGRQTKAVVRGIESSDQGGDGGGTLKSELPQGVGRVLIEHRILNASNQHGNGRSRIRPYAPHAAYRNHGIYPANTVCTSVSGNIHQWQQPVRTD